MNETDHDRADKMNREVDSKDTVTELARNRYELVFDIFMYFKPVQSAKPVQRFENTGVNESRICWRLFEVF